MRHLEIAADAGTVCVDRIPTGWSIEVDAATDGVTGGGPAGDLLQTALDTVAAAGGGLACLWVKGGDAPLTVVAQRHGFAEERSLHQLRRSLPVGEVFSLDVRPFVIGQDEESWLEVNNRAFDWHPEQGGWTRDDLEERFAEPWFDPNGFLVHEVDGRLVGFCWTKVHREESPVLGEIYVIAVDPAAGVKGLGRPLTLAGLDHLHGRGIDVGMLYVDGGNAAALAVYDRLGFRIHRTDVAWTRQVPPR